MLSEASKRGEIMNQSAEQRSEPSLGGPVLLIDEDLEQLEFVQGVIQGIGHSVQACNSYAEGMRQVVSGAFDIVVVGQGSRNFEGRCVLESAIEFNRRLPVVVVGRHLEMGCYLEAMQLGAVDYLAGPFVGGEIARVMRNWAPRRKGRGVEERLASGPISERPIT
jgi:DNA-binding NtrC family response regulator